MDMRPWHALTAAQVLESFGIVIQTGLSVEEAASRLLLGKNHFATKSRDTFLRQLWRQLKSPIAIVLLLATAATAFIEHFADAFIIALALFINVAIGIFQEGKAGNAFKALAKEEAPRAVVIRGGEKKEVAAENVVPGDIVLISAGAKIPADIRLLEVHGLTVDEAAISGEWVPVEKNTDQVDIEAPLVERLNMAYAGTLAAAGAATGVVVATGKDTELGKIAKELARASRAETPLQKDIKGIARLLIILVIIVIIGIAVLALHRGISTGDTFLIAISIAVAAIPEGLPAAVTVVLALGMERILRKGGLVRNLLAAETLGATSIILTDKTGTLTEGRMKAVGFVTLSGTTEDADGPLARAMLRAAVLASDGYTEQAHPKKGGPEEIIARGRPMEQAILLAGLEEGFSEKVLRNESPRIDELHFTSTRRFGGMLVKDGGKSVIYTTGVPELFLSRAVHSMGARGGERPFTLENAQYFEEALLRAAREGKRVLAVGKVETTLKAFPPEEEIDSVLKDMELLGFIIFSDVIRTDAKKSVQDIQGAGARVIMLTGDNPETALWFATQVGIAEPGAKAHTGADFVDKTDEEVLALLREHTVFARVAPSDKLRIANILTNAGEVVAMTGDGVNDAPALNAAAIGVALGSGTDVAKEASDLVLLNNSFAVVVYAIEEGRRLRDNVKKIFAYLLSTNFSEIFIIVAALISGLPIPLLPTQIMWANLIEGGAMNVALAFEPLYPSAMKRSPKHPDIRTVLSRDLLKLIFCVGIFTGLMLVALQFYLAGRGLPEDEMRTIMFGALSASSFAGVLSLKSFGTRLWKLSFFSNRVLMFSLLTSIVMLWAALFVPFVQAIVHTVPVSLYDIGVIAGAGLLNLALIEIAKEIFFIGPARRAERVKTALAV